MNQYSEMLIDLITHDMTPDQVCAELGLCQAQETNSFDVSQNEIDNADALINEDEDVEDRPYCTLCEYAIGEVDKMITDKKNEEEVSDTKLQVVKLNSMCLLSICQKGTGLFFIVDSSLSLFQVKQALDAICYELSQPIQKECVAMVNKYTDLIIDMFVSEYTPEQVFKRLGIP